MEEFQGNSNVSKQNQERVKKFSEPLTTDVKLDKKSTAGGLFAQDLKTTARNVGTDIVLPGIKNLVVNIFKNAIDVLFFGRSSRPGQGGYTNYSGYSYPSRTVTYTTDYRNPQMNPIRNTVAMVNDYKFSERGLAEDALFMMKDAIGQYGKVSVADFYDLVGQTSQHTDNNWGWYDLTQAVVTRTFDGMYRIQFPPAVAIS